MSLSFIVVASLVYLIVLFSLVSICEKYKSKLNKYVSNGVIYALSLGVYTTAWTFYGSIGQASENGLGFLGVYLGPTLLAPLWVYLWRKMIRICRLQRITSIADFISARYGKNTSLGILVSVFCLLIIIPYISIQLKALDFSLNILSGSNETISSTDLPFYKDLTLMFSLVFALFAMYFGTRRVDPTEKHPGVVYMVAIESVFKLVCFLVAGIVIIYVIFNGVGDIFSKTRELQNIQSYSILNAGGLEYKSWFWIMILSSVAFFLLPRQFHIAFVENNSINDISTASWLTPLYLFGISILVIPIAFGGNLLIGSVLEPDTYLISIPLSEGFNGIALLVFLGGLAAISGMLIVSVMALSIMISNNIFLPILLNLKTQFRYFLTDLDVRLLQIRRLIILIILLLSYGFYKLFTINYSLVSVGLISFAGIAQLAPMVILGMYWKYSSKTGALVGFIAGFIIWGYTLPVANLSQLGILDPSIAEKGLWGLEWLKPTSLFGIDNESAIANGAFWSLSINLFLHIVVSLYTKRSALEISQSDIFINPEKYYKSDIPKTSVFIRQADFKELSRVLSAIFGVKKYNELLNEYKAINKLNSMPIVAGPDLINFMERYLTGAIGTSSANIVLNNLVEHQPIDYSELIKLMDETYQVYEHSREISDKSAELKNLADQLTQANSQLKELDQLKNEFIANITHELRTPITSIRSLANILKNYEVNEEEKEEFLKIIDVESERISYLVNQVLDIRKLEDKPELHITEFDLIELIRDTVKGFVNIKEERNIEILAENEMIILSDNFKLKQILINLISNGIKFTDSKQGQILIEIANDDSYFTVAIKDNGTGIANENINEIFSKFYQVPLNQEFKTRGSGLGLYITKQFVEQLGGEINVESKLGVGSMFTIQFPHNIDNSYKTNI